MAQQHTGAPASRKTPVFLRSGRPRPILAVIANFERGNPVEQMDWDGRSLFSVRLIIQLSTAEQVLPAHLGIIEV